MSTLPRKTNPAMAAKRRAAEPNTTPTWLKWVSLLCAIAILAGTAAFALYQKDLFAVVNDQRITTAGVRRLAELSFISSPLSTTLESNDIYNQASYYAILNPIRLAEGKSMGITTLDEETKQEIPDLVDTIKLSHLILEGDTMSIEYDYNALYSGLGVEGVSDQAYLETLVGKTANQLFQDVLGELGYTEADFTIYLEEALLLNLIDTAIAENATNKVTEEQKQAYYDEKKSTDYTLYDLSHVLIKTAEADVYGELIEFSEEEVIAAKELAEQILQQAQNGEDFAELAIQFSQDEGSAGNGGSLGNSYTYGQVIGNFVPPFNTTAAALKIAGELSEVIKTEFGYHVIRLDQITEQSYDTVITQITSILASDIAGKEMIAYVNKANIAPADLRDGVIAQLESIGGW